ncbi:MAG: hypothetical protein ACRD1T_03035, partial [Acidimicrobiia bacterium]
MLRRLMAGILSMAALAVFAGCQNQEPTSTPAGPAGPAEVKTTEPPEAMQTITIQMSAENNSGLSGEATLSATDDDKTKIVISLQNSPSGPQPVHIHKGTCANLNPTPEYGLTSLAGGRSDTVVPV